jgi:hypothetical protein
MDGAQIVKVLETLHGERGCTWKELAVEIGISESFLSRIRHRLCGPGPKVLAFLNLSQKTVYLKTEPTIERKEPSRSETN